MTRTKRRAVVVLAAVTATAGVLWVAVGAASTVDSLTPVPAANTKAVGYAPPTLLSPQLAQIVWAQGSYKLENGTPAIPFYGYYGDGSMLPASGAVQSPGHNVEASKSEPDKNTYLRLYGQGGADPNYNYGTHFLFQGHELVGSGATGYITRINLDADGPHRVTLLATRDGQGTALPAIDGSTWDPWAGKLLFSSEAGNKGGIWQASPGYPSQVQDISGALGRGGYEGMQNDSDGNVWVVEDVGGKAGTTNTHAKQPNSYIYRFKPGHRNDLTTGKLQVLQVISLRNGQPIAFHDGQVDQDILSDDTKDLHTYGHTFTTRWVTIHNTSTDGSTPFDANALAKSKSATPFKRPENGQFKPGSDFRQFLFDETGDTNAQTEAGNDFGGFGGVQKLTQSSPSADTGKLTLFYQGNVGHTGFDNVTFFSGHRVAFVEDRGDTLHTQANALDSAFMFDTNTDYSSPSAPPPVRFMAQGRDQSATIDSGLFSVSNTGFQNEGDNEITGIHVSDGNPGPNGILGSQAPKPFSHDRHDRNRWRAFYTQQHGDNPTYELIAAPGH
jgi:hypothetical protein